MSVKFKKLAVASAVAGALGFAGSASAIQLGNTGSTLLVPHVICDTASQTNTLVGAVVTSLNGPAANAAGMPGVATGAVSTTDAVGSPARNASKSSTSSRLHWRFYNVNSQHVLDGTINVTANDFVRFDWCSTVAASGLPQLNGQPGYLVFHDDMWTNVQNDSGIQLQGHSYMITGNWASQAFIPVLTVAGADMGINPTDGYPRVNILRSGITFDSADAAEIGGVAAGFRQVAMRYFLDPALSTGSDFVFWFNRNARGTGADANYDRTRTPVEVFDSEQVYKFSFNVDLSNELNIITNTPTSPSIPGMTTGFDGDATNTGLVHFYVPTANLSAAATNYGAGDVNAGWRHSGVAFGFVRLGAGANANQVQTELATEGLWLTGPF